jgi:glycosyltransferase involved in cell wall biosynthesis
MRILLVTPSPPAPSASSAVPVVAWAQLRGLSARHEITVVTIAGPDPSQLDALAQLRAAGFDVRAVERRDSSALARGARWLRNALRWLLLRRPMYVVWHHEPALQRLIDALCAERTFDVVHVNDSAMAGYAFPDDVPRLLVEIEARAPRAVDWAGWMRGSWYRGIMDEADWHWWRRHQRGVWRAFDRIEVFTQRDAETVARIAPTLATRVHVDPFGIELPAVADRSLEEEGNIAFVGTFIHAPNVDAAQWLARDVMPLLRARSAGARLHLYGADPRGVLAELARDDVHVHGWVPEIGAALARAAVIAAPVRVGGGQRMKVLQAMAMAKAIVTTSRGADGIMFDGEPPLAIADTADTIADRIAELLAAPARRRALGARARATAEAHHDAAAYGARLESGYAAVLAARARRAQRAEGGVTT